MSTPSKVAGVAATQSVAPPSRRASQGPYVTSPLQRRKREESNLDVLPPSVFQTDCPPWAPLPNLATVSPSGSSCSPAPMTVGTDDLTLPDLFKDALPGRPAVRHGGNACGLNSPDIIEVKNYRVALGAIRARFAFKVSVELGFNRQPGGTCTSPSLREMGPMMSHATGERAGFTPRLVTISSTSPPMEFVQVFGYSAFRADFGTPGGNRTPNLSFVRATVFH